MPDFDPEVWRKPFKLRIEADAVSMFDLADLLAELARNLDAGHFPNRRVGGGASRSYIITGECPPSQVAFGTTHSAKGNA